MSTSRSIRYLHTSSRALRPEARSSTLNLDSLRPKSQTPGSSTSNGFDASSAVKSVISALARSRQEEQEEPRKSFVPDRLLHPEAISAREIDAPHRPNPKPPLLGPPKRLAKQIDPFILTGSKPIEHIYNPSFMGAFLNPLGRLRSRAETGLTWKSQKGVARAVRRARCMGIISYWTDTPPVGGYGPPLQIGGSASRGRGLVGLIGSGIRGTKRLGVGSCGFWRTVMGRVT
ncbi:hypothetical protein BCR39DRAFT_589706 [Naematelia encephala]|uniref:Small ribosomal subunit protein bS18m n=1 Tax=Naematelia encephala TaxID=71784 RepID=A0A1Y2AUS4_9TREE|nr:hypothetical protein BCR39DRAFT_589706 [Naematelia encephala]